ncbi:uncharacterized protein LOC144560701 isoform X2 [Carex rostrata]
MASLDPPQKSSDSTEATTLLERLAQILSQPLPLKTEQPSRSGTTDDRTPPISVKLTGHNYGLWAQVVEMHLAGKEKLGYINGTLPAPPTTNENYAKWFAEDSTVKAWLIGSMDSALIGNFIRFPCARDVWKAVVVAYFDGKDKTQVYNLRRKVTRLKQSGRPLEEYFNNLQFFWQEIDFRRPNPMECPKDIEKHNSLVQEERVYNFLDGLDDRLDSIRAEVLRMEPFPSIEEAFARIRQEDVRQNYHLEKVENNTPVAMVVKENEAHLIPARSGQTKPRPPPGGCTHCGGIKHTRETCFKLHGYPDWWKDPKKKKQQGNDAGKATIASGYPHEGDYWVWF